MQIPNQGSTLPQNGLDSHNSTPLDLEQGSVSREFQADTWLRT
ncbi:hypothetical protein [Nostoc sp.]